MEMKSSGMYLARPLVDRRRVRTDVCEVTLAFRACYDAAAAMMARLRPALDEACRLTKSKRRGGPTGPARALLQGALRGGQVDFVAHGAGRSTRAAVVIGLQTTGEAGLERLLEKHASNNKRGGAAGAAGAAAAVATRRTGGVARHAVHRSRCSHPSSRATSPRSWSTTTTTEAVVVVRIAVVAAAAAATGTRTRP